MSDNISDNGLSTVVVIMLTFHSGRNVLLMVDTLHAYWLLLLVNMETKRKYVILTKNITPEHWNISKPIPVSYLYTLN